MYDFYRQINNWQDQFVRGQKIFYDSTIKHGQIEGITYNVLVSEANDLVIYKDLVVKDDATVRDTLIVERLIEAQDVHVYKDLVVQDDATIKGDLYAEGLIIGTIDVGKEAQDFHVWKDIIVQDDATVKGDLNVDGVIRGSSLDIGKESQDFHVWKDLVVQDDATIRDMIYVESDIRGTQGFLDLGGRSQASTVRLQGPGTNNLIDIESLSFTVCLGGSEHFVIDQNTGYLHIHSNEVFFQIPNHYVAMGMRSSDSYTVHGSPRLYVRTDATVTHHIQTRNLTVENVADLGRIWSPNLDVQDAKINKDLLVQDDATVKDDLRVEGIITGSFSLVPSSVTETLDLWIHKDLLVQDDATIKNDLYVDGRIRGTVDDAWRAQEAQDFKVHKDLVVQDDATVKDDLWVEGVSTIYSGPYKALVCRIKTGTYTGDGSEGQGITGVGFAPKFVWIFKHPAGGDTEYHMLKIDQTWGDYAVYGYHSLSAANMVNSLDADGFTVDDAGANADPNANFATYDYIALG